LKFELYDASGKFVQELKSQSKYSPGEQTVLIVLKEKPQEGIYLLTIVNEKEEKSSAEDNIRIRKFKTFGRLQAFRRLNIRSDRFPGYYLAMIILTEEAALHLHLIGTDKSRLAATHRFASSRSKLYHNVRHLTAYLPN